ncbi:hypothetical protein [Anaeropeptidivorans aminofermentans]|jgi:hypothetical protein|uniref:hypothetical protein n=1 Tax=Anaeropeptidivorans aminofermentans TaxID=2934315 RepID=UPI00202429D4|nr:hypothetical protein [Anaeropeptidivorans aminofermentans]
MQNTIESNEKRGRKSFFGYIEVVFNIVYLISAFMMGMYIFSKGGETFYFLAGAMAMLLAIGDAFHLIPRIAAVMAGRSEKIERLLGFGKLITSITMTVFYVLLWHIGIGRFQGQREQWTLLIYAFAAIRIFLCLLPQNGWYEKEPSLKWAVIRNIPFVFLGLAVILLFGLNGGSFKELRYLWLAALFSFIFYIPVVIWAGKYPKIGMLMIPKTCMYLWILLMLMSV